MSASTPWKQTPAFADLVATLDEMQLKCDPNPATGEDWPSPDPIVCLRFHRKWTQRMLARTGIDPLLVTEAPTARKRWADGGFTNTVYGVLGDTPAEAMPINQVLVALELPRGKSAADHVAAALARLYKGGKVERRKYRRAGPGPRAGYAYYRRAA